jgi:hypothetical protein
MDWNLFWTAAGVVLALGGIILTCCRSMNNNISQIEVRLSEKLSRIDQRLSRLEGAFEERGKWESKRNYNG